MNISSTKLLSILAMLCISISLAQTKEYEGLWHLKGEGSFAHSKMYLKFKMEGDVLNGAFKNDDGTPDVIYKTEVTDSTLIVYFTTSGTPANIKLTKITGNPNLLKAKLLNQFSLNAEKVEEGSTFDFELPDINASSPPEEIRRKLMAEGEIKDGKVNTAFASTFEKVKLTIDVSNQIGELIRTERYNNLTDSFLFTSERDEDVAFYNEMGLHGELYKLWIYDADFYNPKTGQYNYSNYADYIADASKISDHLMFNMNGRGITGDWGVSIEESKRILTQILTDLKSTYPAFTYIEVLNEPDYEKRLTPVEYYSVYKVFYQAVNDVNRKLNPKEPLKIGGPSTAQFDLNWIRTFLDEYQKDGAAEKRLDFISYHGYFSKPEKEYLFYKDNPSLVANQRSILEQELKKRDIAVNIPTFVSEMGIYPGPLFDDYGNMKNDRLRQAAGVMSINYWYLNSKNTYPFNWVLRHQTEGRKDQLVTRDSTGNKMIYTRKFTPYGNSILMASNLKKTRVAADVSRGLEDGKGIYSIASVDETGIAVMLWNYQSRSTIGYKVDIAINNLPKAFKRRGTIKVKTALIDPTHSNYQYDIENCNLIFNESEVASIKDGVFTQQISIEPNSLFLIVLEK